MLTVSQEPKSFLGLLFLREHAEEIWWYCLDKRNKISLEVMVDIGNAFLLYSESEGYLDAVKSWFFHKKVAVVVDKCI